MDQQTLGLMAALVALALGGLWKLTRVENALHKDIVDSHDAVDGKLQSHSREFGETVAAIRQKVADVELYASNHYVRRDGFLQVQAGLENQIRVLGDKIDARLDRMEAKIDTKS